MWEHRHDRAKALEVTRRLWSLFPDDLEIGLKLASFAQPDAALAIAVLRNLPPPASENPRIDLAELRLIHHLPAWFPVLERAQEKARANGQRARSSSASARTSRRRRPS